MKPKKRKNIEPYLADIRHPSRKIRDDRTKLPDKFFVKETTGEAAPLEPPLPKKRISRKNKIIFAVFLFFFTLVLGYQFVNNVVFSVRNASQKFDEASGALGLEKGTVPQPAATKKETGLDFSKIVSYLKFMPDFFASVKTLNVDMAGGVRLLTEIKSSGFNWLFEDGQKLIVKLGEAGKAIDKINADFIKVRTHFSALGMEESVPQNYLQLQSSFIAASDFIKAATDFISQGNHLLILFENDSEIRPAGGFVGSYADVYFRDGMIKQMEVNDILLPDNQWNSKIIPPKPLWPISQSWEARDANWFFDFPLSAEKIIGLLEDSPLYSSDKVKFGGAVAINTKVIQDILTITGPVELKERGITLDADNFVVELQKEVSTDALERGSARKQILKDLTPLLIEKIRTLEPKQADALFGRLSERAKNKDIKIYFREQKIEALIDNLGIGGKSFALPENFFGDYLAVVNANVNGGKTDAFMKQNISLATRILANGDIESELQITREHTGGERKESFYRATNQNFLRILVPKGSRETKVKGASVKTITAPINFAGSGYKKDAEVQLFESGEESGKAWFGHWFNIALGQEKKLEIFYSRPSVIVSRPFRFIYEKQSGVETGLQYKLEAPPEYIFEETGTNEFLYAVENAPSRLVIPLNLKKSGQ